MSHPLPYILPHLRRFRLLDLPVEIRNDILEIHFFGEKLAESSVCCRPNPFISKNYPILETNQQIYQEASAVLDRGAVLHLELNMYERDINPGHMVLTSDVTHRGISEYWSSTSLESLKQWPRFNRIRHFRLCISSAINVGKWMHTWPGSFPEILFQYCSKTVDFLRYCPDIQTVTLHVGYPPEVNLTKSLKPLLDIPNTSKALCFAACTHELHRRNKFYPGEPPKRPRLVEFSGSIKSDPGLAQLEP